MSIFFKKNLRDISICCYSYCLFYFLSGIRHGESFVKATLGSFIQKGQLGVFWYFGAMIIIYALLPGIAYLYKAKYKTFIALTVGLLLMASIFFLLNFSSGIHIEQNTIQTFRLWNWLFYFCLGGILRHCSFRVNIFVLIILIVLNYLFQTMTSEYMESVYCEYFYPSVIVMLLSLCVFQYIRNIKLDLKFVNGGKLFLPCYTIHMFVIGQTLKPFKHIFSFMDDFCPALYFVFVCAVTMLLSWVMMKIPYLEKVFRI